MKYQWVTAVSSFYGVAPDSGLSTRGKLDFFSHEQLTGLLFCYHTKSGEREDAENVLENNTS